VPPKLEELEVPPKLEELEAASPDALPSRPVAKITRGERNIRWIERHCYIPEGKLVGSPVHLTEKQKEWVRLIYDTPTRTFILSMGRKNAKTAFSAMLLLLHLCGPEAQRNSQLFSTGLSREQAAVIFDLAAKMVRLSPDLSAVVIVRDTVKQLVCRELGTMYRALSAEATTAFGLSPAFVVHDELGQVRGPRHQLFEAMETAAAAQESPISIIISTQAPNDIDLLSLLIDDAKKPDHDPRVKLVLYTANEEMDPFSDEAIRAANPHYEDFMNQEEVKRQGEEAKRLPSREASYRNLVLNQRIESSNPFVTRAIWDENGAMPLPLARGKVYYGGLDLSAVNDLTALVLMSEEFDVHPTFWLPDEGLEEKSRMDKVPYDLWKKQGFLIGVPGRAIEYEYIAEYLRGIFDSINIKKMAFDRYNIKFLKPWLTKVGFTEEELSRFVDFGQGYVSMSPAIRELEAKLLTSRLKHGKHPVLAMCAGNARIIQGTTGNRKFVKAKSTGRIDGMTALTMAIGVMPQQMDTSMGTLRWV